MLRMVCAFLVSAGAITMTASIFVYWKTITKYAGYLFPGKKLGFNRYTFILVLMIFFLLGYLGTVFYIMELAVVEMSILLIATIFFFGAIFCYAVVHVQSDFLDRLEQNAGELRNALESSENANKSLEAVNSELTSTMDALKNTQSHLIFTEKMSALGKLMAGISHEINTPISAVNASASSMRGLFSGSFDKLYTDIRGLSDEGFAYFCEFAKKAADNSRNITSTMQLRSLKKNARKRLEEAEGFDDGLFDILVRNSLLDDETVERIAPLMKNAEFRSAIGLISSTVSLAGAIDTVSVASEMVIKMVSSLKTFSHFSEGGEMSSFRVTAGIETVLAIYVNQLKYDIDVKTEFDDVPEINGYQDELNHVWSNLIQNAIHAVKERGENTVKSERGQITITVKNCDGGIDISIADNGCGIKPDITDKIFEPFYTTKLTGIGTGLGLSISRQIVDKHNGTITIESKEGQGAKFTVFLPITD